MRLETDQSLIPVVQGVSLACATEYTFHVAAEQVPTLTVKMLAPWVPPLCAAEIRFDCKEWSAEARAAMRAALDEADALAQAEGRHR